MPDAKKTSIEVLYAPQTPAAQSRGSRPAAQNVWASQRPTARATVVALDSDMPELSHTLRKNNQNLPEACFFYNHVQHLSENTENRERINKNQHGRAVLDP